MRVLLDTHMILWAADNNPMLPQGVREILLDDNNEIYYSVASLWKITIKHLNRPDRMPSSGSKIGKLCDMMGYKIIHISDSHVASLETIKREEGVPAHNDPFDRMLIAQAKSEQMMFLTHDAMLSYYNEPCVELFK